MSERVLDGGKKLGAQLYRDSDGVVGYFAGRNASFITEGRIEINLMIE